ncbi:hypothetical protein MMC17_002904 [Xylographa soralifera]|nr:hypothetical protein [Xylographa soralifera]
MNTQACQPCVKRKVRCDRNEPCSNCKRRKQDQCVYPELSPTERIKQLEALVRSLRGSSEHSTPYDHEQAKTKAASASSRVQQLQNDTGGDNRLQRGTNPMIVKEDGEFAYLESWNGKIFESVTALRTSDGYPRTPVLSSIGSSALQSIICRDPYIDLARRHPTPQDATALWDIFYRRVHPVVKISFNWEIEPLRATAIAPNGPNRLAFPDHAFIFAVYLISVTSLSEDECSRLLGQPKSALFSDFQILCEQALAGSNFLGASDIATIQASTMYIIAGIERFNTRSLWSMMGAVVRNAERCGLHRDGTVLGLSPYETERRRRLWWQLQHLDIALGVKSGSVSLTLIAPWDAKLPLNIEDEDIDPHMREAPKERQGLTSMSQCLWTYFILHEQRSFCRADGSKLGFTWAADKSLSRAEKLVLIDRIEAGLNQRYLQFCDPIRPLDVLIQILARSFVYCMRRLALHPLAHDDRVSKLSEYHRKELLDVCIQCLEYDVASHSSPSIKHFRWRFQGYFQWSALIYVLVEARRQFDTPEAERIWALLSDVYTANSSLSELQEDRRKSYVVELMIVAWRARENFLVERQQHQLGTYRPPQKPAFLVDLENRLLKYIEAGKPEGPTKRKLGEVETRDPTPIKKLAPPAGTQGRDLPMDNTTFSQFDLDTFAEVNFDAIDWSFWEAGL